MNSNNNIIVLKLGGKIIFQHQITKLKNLSYIIKEKQNSKKLQNNNKDVIPRIDFNNNRKNIKNEMEQKIINDEKLLKKFIDNSGISHNKPKFTEEISKNEFSISSLENSLEKSKSNNYIKFKEMLSILKSNRENLKLKEINNKDYNNITSELKKEILNSISLNKNIFCEKLNLNKSNIDSINKKLEQIKQNNQNFKFENKNPNKDEYKIKECNNVNNNRAKDNKLNSDYFELFKNFVGNSKLSDRIIISYFDIEHPNIKIAAQRYFKSKYGIDEITLIYIYQDKPNETFAHKFKLISDINELFITAQNNNIKFPKLILKNGKEIKNNKKIKCIGALYLDDNSIIKIIQDYIFIYNIY